MCNLYSNTVPVEAMRRLFDAEAEELGNQPPLSAVFPRGEAPVLRVVDGRRRLTRMHWGFVLPQTSKRTGQPILPKAVNNARADKLATSPFWRESFERRRCLVPASSFCEAKGRSPARYVWFALTGDAPRPPFAFAGLWRRFRGRYKDDLVEIDTYTVVTTEPNALVATVHPDRMPVILDPGDYAAWLDAPPAEALALARPFPAERMRIVREGTGEKADPLP